MSNRKSLGNTLLNYFSKSPKSAPSTPKTLERKIAEPEKRPRPPSCSESDDEVCNRPNKKLHRVLSDSDSDIENKSHSNLEHASNKTQHNLSLDYSFTKAKDSPKPSKIISQIEDMKEKSNSNESEGKIVFDTGSWTHDKLEFLKAEKMCDIKKRKVGDPNYDPTTLYVPEDFKNKQTPAMRQWWEIKSQHFDSVLFFKVGKFYELYHMDAVVGVNELGFSYMKGDFAHSGFPESAFARMSTSLVERGYKVARVEQTETPEMMAERVRKGGASKFDKVVKREVCQVTNKGTVTCSAQSGQPSKSDAAYMLIIIEKDNEKYSEYGICFLETSVGEFHLGQFIDDNLCSRLLTLLACYPPVLVLHERGMITERTRKVMASALSGALKEALAPNSQVWPVKKCLQILAEKYYHKDGQTIWPQDIKQFLSESDNLSPVEKYELGVKALGAAVCYLRNCCLDQQVISRARYFVYNPPDTEQKQDIQTKCNLPEHMILDAITLYNLRVVGPDGSLLSKIDHCCTAFGKRLLRQMICAPSCVLSVIKKRQEAVEYFLDNPVLLQEIRKKLSQLPDLERHIAQIHTNGNYTYNKLHPDSRAIFYEQKTYVKRKICDFIATLNAFELITQFNGFLSESSSDLLRQITCTTPIGQLPDIQDELIFFKNAFDHEQAEKDGVIVPITGVDKDYDEAMDNIKKIEDELASYLKDQCRYFGCEVTYHGNDKKRFTLEVPAHAAGKAGRDYSLEGQKKGAKRFTTTTTKYLLERMIQAEAAREAVLKDLSRRIYEKFSSHFDKWNAVVNCISILDIIACLAEYSRVQSFNMIMPTLIQPSKDIEPFIKFEESRHPCIGDDNFIPNTVYINANDWASLSLLTGPNMGGKSTLMRQVGLLTILAQMGSRIPADAAELVLVDRIFTRLGANDDILTGHSTFFVEMSETATILNHATKNSLVFLDELGRGTSTYDGTAIAAAVLRHLATQGCRTMFSTHYHSLVEDFQSFENVSLGHMACMVESDEQENDVQQETVTFLYKYIAGPCPKSYGFNAARLAGIPKEITSRAYKYSTAMEAAAYRRKVFINLCIAVKNDSWSEVRSILSNYEKYNIKSKK